jgi:hypothetical protein
MPELDVSGNIVDMQDELDLADLDQDITNALATITAGLVELEDAQWNPKTTVQKGTRKQLCRKPRYCGKVWILR